MGAPANVVCQLLSCLLFTPQTCASLHPPHGSISFHPSQHQHCRPSIIPCSCWWSHFPQWHFFWSSWLRASPRSERCCRRCAHSTLFGAEASPRKSLLIQTFEPVDFTQFIMHFPIIKIHRTTSHFRLHKIESRSNTTSIQKSTALFAFQYDSLAVCVSLVHSYFLQTSFLSLPY